MESLRQYILSVAAGAMLCGALLSIAPEGVGKELLRFTAGLLLTLCVLGPLRGGAGELSFSWPDTSAGEALAAEGEKQAAFAVADSIRAKTEAYILDKAAALGAAIEVEVTVGEGELPLPETVTIRGAVSPYIRGQLEEMLDSDLGIPKEHQRWKQ